MRREIGQPIWPFKHSEAGVAWAFLAGLLILCEIAALLLAWIMAVAWRPGPFDLAALSVTVTAMFAYVRLALGTITW